MNKKEAIEFFDYLLLHNPELLEKVQEELRKFRENKDKEQS